MSVEAIEVPAAPAPEANWQRWLVMALATAGLLLVAYGFTLLWSKVDTSLKAQAYYSVVLAADVALFCVAWLVAWRAGHSIANLSLALAFTAASINDSLSIVLLMFKLEHTLLYDVANALTFIAGAGLFLRASQQFPRLITANLIAASPVLLVKTRPIRAAFTAMLRPIVLWPLTIILGAIATLADVEIVFQSARLLILAIGIAYFYLNYRAGDADVQRKVLWFLAAVIAVAAVAFVGLLIQFVLGDGSSETFSTVVVLTLQSVSSLALIACVAAAIFYAGAISPRLVIRKTVVYGLTTALLLFVFATVEVYLHHQIVHFLHVTDTLASSLIGGVFGLTFHPVKHYFEHLLAKRHAGSKH